MPGSFSFDLNAFDTSPTHQAVHNILDYLSMASFPTTPPNLLYASVPLTLDGVDQEEVPLVHMTDDRMVEILLQMENFLSISNNKKAFSESIRAHVNGKAGKNRPILQPTLELPAFVKQQCEEVIADVPEDLCNVPF